MRVFCLFLLLALLVILPFLWFGDGFDAWLNHEGAVEWLRSLGAWGWLGGLGLLAADLVLPIPGTVVISALGYLYGTLLGGVLGTAGSILSGAIGYGLSRKFGRSWAERFAGADTLDKYETLFARSGLGLVAFSRWMPLLPEVVSCLAGLSRMPPRRFFPALTCGSLPLGFIYAFVGATGVHHPGWALVLSALLPLVCLGMGKLYLQRRRQFAPSTDSPPAP